MRTNFSNPKVSFLRYEIREIVDVVQRLKEIDPGFKVIGENIGDPIVKGWRVPAFVKQLIVEEIQREGDAVFGYSHSRGNPEVRKWVARLSQKLFPSSTLDYEYVLFTNGLGAAISALYNMVPQGSRMIQPAPTYPSHASMESFESGAEPLFYKLDPFRNWEPDLDHLESQIRSNPQIAGITMINPNNPTGAVYAREVLEEITGLAERYQLMILSDEIYFRMVYNNHKFVSMVEVAGKRVPLIVLRGLSKDVPWPGGRCGWVEFHNVDLDEGYRSYCDAVKKRILLEVCSVHLPQAITPRLYDHPEFPAWNREYNAELEKISNSIAVRLESIESLMVNRANGAFYMMPLFREGALNDRQTLRIENPEIRKYVEQEVGRPGVAPDKRFAFYLLAATGICVVPASGFYSDYPGFRITTLERNEKIRNSTYSRLTEAIREYLR